MIPAQITDHMIVDLITTLKACYFFTLYPPVKALHLEIFWFNEPYTKVIDLEVTDIKEFANRLWRTGNNHLFEVVHYGPEAWYQSNLGSIKRMIEYKYSTIVRCGLYLTKNTISCPLPITVTYEQIDWESINRFVTFPDPTPNPIDHKELVQFLLSLHHRKLCQLINNLSRLQFPIFMATQYGQQMRADMHIKFPKAVVIDKLTDQVLSSVLHITNRRLQPSSELNL